MTFSERTHAVVKVEVWDGEGVGAAVYSIVHEDACWASLRVMQRASSGHPLDLGVKGASPPHTSNFGSTMGGG